MREGAHVARRELVGRREASQLSQAWRSMIQKSMSLNTGGCARNWEGTRRRARGLAACGPRRAASRRIAPPARKAYVRLPGTHHLRPRVDRDKKFGPRGYGVAGFGVRVAD